MNSQFHNKAEQICGRNDARPKRNCAPATAENETPSDDTI